MSVYTGCSRTLNLVLLAFLAGCGGGGGTGSGSGGSGGPPPAPPDTSVPTVTTMTPGEDSAGMATNGRITATFSEAMVPAGINTEIFRLTNGANAVTGTVSYDTANNIAVFTPAGGLVPNTRYTATIVTGIKDLGNNPLTTDFAWCFETGGAADNTAPGVSSTFPANAAAGVATNRRISATFSKDMNASTITPATFTVRGPGATVVSGTVAYLGRTAVFTPSNGLAPNTAHTATITTGAMDLADNATQSNMAWSFTTGANADVAAPVVLSTSPANAATGVAIGSTINVTFSEPLNPATITTATFKVTMPGALPVIGTVAFDVTSNTATFTRINHLSTFVSFHPTPVSNLDPNTTYTATVTTGARDMAGNALAGNLVLSFTTAP